MTTTPSTAGWKVLNPSLALELSDARLQFHYAAQFATALGISYLAPLPDDSHTNLGWDPNDEALRSREVRAHAHAVRVAVRPRDMTVIVLLDGVVAQRIPLHGTTISQVEAGLRSALAAAGLDARRLTLRRHYELPAHPVAEGDPFDTSASGEFAELANWYGSAAVLLGELSTRVGSSEVRCWPHHFDIATLATIAPGRTSSAGMLPGDEMYKEPYFYVNASPLLRPEQLTTQLDGGGTWNSDGWTGAVLTGSRLSPDGPAQEAQVRAFLTSAVSMIDKLLKV